MANLASFTPGLGLRDTTMRAGDDVDAIATRARETLPGLADIMPGLPPVRVLAKAAKLLKIGDSAVSTLPELVQAVERALDERERGQQVLQEQAGPSEHLVEQDVPPDSPQFTQHTPGEAPTRKVVQFDIQCEGNHVIYLSTTTADTAVVFAICSGGAFNLQTHTKPQVGHGELVMLPNRRVFNINESPRPDHGDLTFSAVPLLIKLYPSGDVEVFNNNRCAERLPRLAHSAPPLPLRPSLCAATLPTHTAQRLFSRPPLQHTWLAQVPHLHRQGSDEWGPARAQGWRGALRDAGRLCPALAAGSARNGGRV